MFRRGYEYDYYAKLWLPMSDMQPAGCLYTDAYPSDLTKIGIAHGNVPSGTTIPKGIPDPDFSEEESKMPPTQFGVFQDVLTQFQTVTATWLGGLYQIGTSLFYMLATIELILVGITGTLRRDFDQLAIDLVRTVAGIMAMFTLFKYGPGLVAKRRDPELHRLGIDCRSRAGECDDSGRRDDAGLQACA